MNQASVKLSERTLYVKGESTSTNFRKKGSSRDTWSDGIGHGRHFIHGGQRGKGAQGISYENKNNVQCFHCKKFGHVKSECWAREKQPKKGATLVAE